MISLSLSTRYTRPLLWSTLALTLHLCPASGSTTPQTAPDFRAAVAAADTVQEAFVKAAERVQHSVVTIYVERKQPFSLSNTPEQDEENNGDQRLSPIMPDDRLPSLGTGMAVDGEGTVLTNYHVVKNATLIRVLVDANGEHPQRLLAKMTGFDEESDLAVLQLIDYDPEHTPLKPIKFADSDTVRVGEWAIAIGAPFDQAQSVTVGIVSAKGRHLNKEDQLSLQDYLQTDASINPGNSGGPLLNLDGQVIGINTAILSPSQFNVGIGFAVPSNTARAYWPLLKAGQTIARGFLGIRYVAVDDAVARELEIAGGMQVGGLARQGKTYLGPAHAADLREGDIITHVDGQTVTTTRKFRHLVASLPPGKSARFTVLRPEDTITPTRQLSITLGDWSTLATPATTGTATLPTTAFSRLGLQITDGENLTLTKRDELGLESAPTGAVITGVLPGSPADIAQLQQGFSIEKVRLNGSAWKNIVASRAFTELENSLARGETLLLIVRDKRNSLLYKAVRIP